MTTRHSKQMPMPHNGPRGSPVTEVLHALPAIAIATATVTPTGTTTRPPSTVIVISLGMDGFLPHSRRQIWLNRNLRLRSHDLIRKKASCRQRCRDSQPLVPGCKKQGLVSGPRTKKGQLVGSGGAKSSPRAHRRQRTHPRHVFLGSTQHAGQYLPIDFFVLSSVLPRRSD